MDEARNPLEDVAVQLSQMNRSLDQISESLAQIAEAQTLMYRQSRPAGMGYPQLKLAA